MTLDSKGVGSKVFWTLCIMGAFAILSSTMSKSPVLNPFAVSLSTPTELIGLVSAASTIPGILVSLPAASLSDIFGRKKFLLFAGFVFASAPFLYLLITAWWQLILVRFYHGFATAIFVPVAEASIAELFPNKRGERISLFTSATYIGRLAAPTLGGYILVVTNKNFHDLYLVAAVAGVTALIMALPFLAERKKQVNASQKKTAETLGRMFHGWKTIIRNRGALTVSFIQGSHYYVYGSVEFFLTDYLTRGLGYSLLIPGLITTCVIGVALFARPYMGRVSDRTGRRFPIIAGSMVSGLALLPIPFVTDFWVILSLVMIYGFGFATVVASTSPLVSELVPSEFVGTSMGFLAMTMDVGQTIGPIVTGFVLATSLAYKGAFWTLALVLLFSCAVFVLSGVARAKISNRSQQDAQ